MLNSVLGLGRKVISIPHFLGVKAYRALQNKPEMDMTELYSITLMQRLMQRTLEAGSPNDVYGK